MTWSGDYVYYGGHRFRVLAKDTTDFSADDGMLPPKHTMLLDSDSVLNEHIHFDNDAKPNTGAKRASEWEYSDLKAWLNNSNNGFLKGFSKAEIAGIASSTKPDPVANDGKGFPNMRYAPLKDDRVFVLDAVEASRPDYGYSATTGDVQKVDDSLSRVKTTDGEYDTVYCQEVGDSGIWWLRSPFYSPRYTNYGGFVNGVSAQSGEYFEEGGFFSTNMVSYSGPGPSPALNVDLDSVLLSTCVSYYDENYYNNDYKLTLIYDKLETAITQGKNISINGGNVTVPYTVTDKDPDDGIQADYISVLVVEGDRTTGTIKKYEPLTDSLVFNNGTASGEATFTLPSNFFDSKNDKIYVFAEDTNESDVLTDYASAPLELLQPGAVSDLVYNGTEQTLLNDTSTIPTGYSVQYALSESAPAEGSYASEIPKAKNAGTYRIWYKATENNASNTIGPNSMTVTIAKKPVEVSGVTASDKQYDGTRNITLSGGTLNASDIISGDTISIASLEGRLKYADAGENKPVTITKITLDGASKDNYAASYTDQNNLTATVTQKPVKVTGIKVVDKEYDGTKTATLDTQNASIEGIVDIDSIVLNPLTVSTKSTAEFEDAEFGKNKTVNLGIKLGGFCSLNYTLSEDSQKTATANITKSITIKANDQRVGRGGTIKSGVDNVSVTSGSLEEGHRISNVTLISDSTDSLTNDGTITLESVVIRDADENDVTAKYTITLESGVLTVTGKAQIPAGSITAPVKIENLTYNGSAQNLVTAGEAEGGTMMYALGTATEATEAYTTSIPTATDAGTYYVWYKVKGDDCHNDFVATTPVEVDIAKAETSGGTNTDSKPNAPTAQDPKDAGSDVPKEEGTTITDTKSGATFEVTSDKGQEPTVEYKAPDSKEKKVEIPETVQDGKVTYKVTGISAKAFKGNKTIESVKIPATVTQIGDSAFANCSKLTKITLPAKVSKLGKNLFKGCKKLKTISIKNKKLKAKDIKKGAFNGLGKGVTIKVPKGKKKAYEKLFRGKGLSKKVKVK
ncbi:MAG: leucine-rich repeat protein [Lachnospiraceae bacterium]|nr:leucine-rich repeat protein [Lachnospiraceae bacterium]